MMDFPNHLRIAFELFELLLLKEPREENLDSYRLGKSWSLGLEHHGAGTGADDIDKLITAGKHSSCQIGSPQDLFVSFAQRLGWRRRRHGRLSPQDSLDTRR